MRFAVKGEPHFFAIFLPHVWYGFALCVVGRIPDTCDCVYVKNAVPLHP